MARPTAPASSAQPGSQGGGNNRIDPAQIPRPTTQLGDTSSVKVFETRVGGKAALPPASTSAFVAVDTGNCSPRYVRPTLNVVPTSADLASNCKMPFALVVQPMALLDESLSRLHYHSLLLLLMYYHFPKLRHSPLNQSCLIQIQIVDLPVEW